MKIAIIGANEFQTKLILKCKENNIETHVFAWEEGAIGKKYSDFFYPISIVEKEKILSKCKDIGIDGIISIGSDLAVITVNYIAEQLNLIGNSMESTVLSTNKYEMRKALRNYNVECPKFISINEGEVDTVDINLSLPMIVKPTDRSGSRGVTKVETYDDLEQAIDNAFNESFSKKIIIEEYIGGKEYSMEFISDNGSHKFLTITEKFTTGAPNFIERAHIQPGRINEEILKQAIETAKLGLDALKIENGASHVEIKIEDSKVFIIEIGARMGGDFIGSDLVKLSTGIDFTQAVINKALAKKIEITQLYNKYSLVYFIFNEKDYIKIKENYDLLSRYIIEDKINNEIEFKAVTDSSNRNGYLIFQFDTYKEFKRIEEVLF